MALLKTRISILILATLCLVSFLAGCASDEKRTAEVDPYLQAMDRNSAGDEEYSGFYNQFSFKGTLLNSTVRDWLIKKQTEYYQWDESKIAIEKDKSAQEQSSQTQIFVSFYTPDRKNDNLTDSKSIWRIYLDAGGKRYVGKVQKSRRLLAELVALYPYHTRWNTPYVFTFPVGTAAIEKEKAELTITGPLGTRSVVFTPAVQ